MITIRHERALVMLATYAIGFTTAYISFGVAGTTTPMTANVYTAVENIQTNEQVVESEPQVSDNVEEDVVAEAEELKPTSASLEYKEGKLEYLMNGNSILLSFNPEVSDIKLPATTLTQGYHYGDLVFSMFDFGRYVFFCEQHEAKAKVCTPYLYDTVANTIFTVSNQGSQLEITLEEAKNATYGTKGLQIGDYHSTNALTPQSLQLVEQVVGQDNADVDLQVQ